MRDGKRDFFFSKNDGGSWEIHLKIEFCAILILSRRVWVVLQIVSLILCKLDDLCGVVTST